MNIICKQTDNSPLVSFNSQNGELSIIGISASEDPIKLYEKIQNEVAKFCRINALKKIIIYLQYFNTSSYKSLLELLIEIKSKHNPHIIVEWQTLVDDEDLIEAGEELAALCGFEFQYVTVNE